MPLFSSTRYKALERQLRIIGDIQERIMTFVGKIGFFAVNLLVVYELIRSRPPETSWLTLIWQIFIVECFFVLLFIITSRGKSAVRYEAELQAEQDQQLADSPTEEQREPSP